LYLFIFIMNSSDAPDLVPALLSAQLVEFRWTGIKLLADPDTMALLYSFLAQSLTLDEDKFPLQVPADSVTHMLTDVRSFRRRRGFKA
jgi:hypothetical protein